MSDYMNLKNITLVGTTFEADSSHKKWWEYQREQARFTEQISQKNSYQLKPVFAKMVEQGVHQLHAPFEGGGDQGGFDENIIFLDKKEKEIEIDYKKLKPDEFRIQYIPLVHKVPTKTKGKSKLEIFEYQYTDYEEHPDVTEDWLVQRFYDFGFLNEWGSFAGEFHVSGTVKIWPKTGAWEMPYSESVENWESHEYDGNMFKEEK